MCLDCDVVFVCRELEELVGLTLCICFASGGHQ